MATQVVSTESVGSGIPDATDASTTITQFANVDEESDLDEGEKKMLCVCKAVRRKNPNKKQKEPLKRLDELPWRGDRESKEEKKMLFFFVFTMT